MRRNFGKNNINRKQARTIHGEQSRTIHGERSRTTSWEDSSKWYNKITGEKGHYYHEHLVIPGVLRLLDLKPGDKLLDLACGNGILGRSTPKGIEYLGVDLSESLISMAKKMDTNINHKYTSGDVTHPLNVGSDFNKSAIILSLQNIKKPHLAIDNASKHLISGGTFVIVLNHPAFRIPRQSSWGIEEKRQIQYRRVDKYMSRMVIPINTNPSDRNSPVTWSYHFPVSEYSKMLKNCGFVITEIEEWTSDKESEGRAAKMENRGRNEIPLFLTLVAKKI